MLTFTSKIIDTFKIIVIISSFATIFIAAIIWWKRNKNREGLSAREYFSNADTSDLTYDQLQELNKEIELMM